MPWSGDTDIRDVAPRCSRSDARPLPERRRGVSAGGSVVRPTGFPARHSSSFRGPTASPGGAIRMASSRRWSAFSPRCREEMELDRVLATVLFTDIVGSTEIAARLGDRAWRAVITDHDRIVRAQLARYRGREVANGRRLPGDLRRACTRYSLRLRDRTPASRCRAREPGRPAHRRAGVGRGGRPRDRGTCRGARIERKLLQAKCWSPPRSRISWQALGSVSRIAANES